jgi:hypothetical protein
LTAKTTNDRQRNQKQKSKKNLQRRQPTNDYPQPIIPDWTGTPAKRALAGFASQIQNMPFTECFEQADPADLGFVF